jgi:hypothetical protein
LAAQSELDTPQNKRKREEHLSKDGQWRSFPKVPQLLQYVNDRNYYRRIKAGGKTIRESLGPGADRHGQACSHPQRAS